MTSNEYKSALAVDLANNNVNLLINELAKAKEEIDSLKAEVEKLKAAAASAADKP